MGKLLFVIFLFLGLCVLWSLPLYLVSNLVLMLFNSPLRITLLQSFALCLLLSVINASVNEYKGGK